MNTTHPAKMTDQYYDLLRRFWKNTNYLAHNQLDRIAKRVEVIDELEKSAKEQVA